MSQPRVIHRGLCGQFLIYVKHSDKLTDSIKVLPGYEIVLTYVIADRHATFCGLVGETLPPFNHDIFVDVCRVLRQQGASTLGWTRYRKDQYHTFNTAII